MLHRIEFWLPFPPSTNRLWRSVGGRVVTSAEYKQWQKRSADALAFEQKLGKSPVLGVHQLQVYLSESLIHRGDADNRLKAVLDCASKARLIINDKDCRKSSVEWAAIDHECTCVLEGEVAYRDQWEFAAYLASSLRRPAVRKRSRA